MYLFISGAEIFVILIIVVMVFGADKLPEIARGLGKGMRQVKDATNDIKREIKNSAEKNDIDIDIASNIKKEINKVTDNIEEYTQPVKKIKDTIIDDITGPIKIGALAVSLVALRDSNGYSTAMTKLVCSKAALLFS